jgi:hypothetical protein
MSRPRTGKRAQASTRMPEIKVGFTPIQREATKLHKEANPGMSERGAIRSIFNAGLRALGLLAAAAAPAVAGRIGPAPQQTNAARAA